MLVYQKKARGPANEISDLLWAKTGNIFIVSGSQCITFQSLFQALYLVQDAVLLCPAVLDSLPRVGRGCLGIRAVAGVSALHIIAELYVVR